MDWNEREKSCQSLVPQSSNNELRLHIISIFQTFNSSICPSSSPTIHWHEHDGVHIISVVVVVS